MTKQFFRQLARRLIELGIPNGDKTERWVAALQHDAALVVRTDTGMIRITALKLDEGLKQLFEKYGR